MFNGESSRSKQKKNRQIRNKKLSSILRSTTTKNNSSSNKKRMKSRKFSRMPMFLNINRDISRTTFFFAVSLSCVIVKLAVFVVVFYLFIFILFLSSLSVQKSDASNPIDDIVFDTITRGTFIATDFLCQREFSALLQFISRFFLSYARSHQLHFVFNQFKLIN